MTELSITDLAIVRRCVHDLTPGDLAKVRQIHAERLAELRPQLAAVERAVAMREESIRLIDAKTPSYERDGIRYCAECNEQLTRGHAKGCRTGQV